MKVETEAVATTVSLARPRGHERVVERLESAASALARHGGAPLAHALIFAGADGVGKYRTALWWARRLKCRASCEEEPSCPDCLRIRAGSHGDVRTLEPGGKGNEIGIEDVRHLIHSMSLKAVSPGPRIGILRDADRLSLDAQGAMLKLLEEPPGLAALVLVTRNPAALLPTVRSRCQTLRFGLLDREALRAILNEHGVEAALAEKALDWARGSAGRAVGLTQERIDARGALLEAFERFRAGGSPGDMLTQLLDAQDGTETALTTLFENLLARVEEALRNGEDHRDLLTSTVRVYQALDALGRRANPRLVVRDMLFDLGES